MNDNGEEVTVIASVPRRNKLCCIVGEIDFMEVQDSSAKSNIHWQIMKCRLIIHVVPEVIASPIFSTDNSMHIITSNVYFQTGKLQKILKNLNILFGDPQPVPINAYKDCLMYTIQCKLAPHWNKVGQYLVQGREFFNSMENLKAIRLNIIMDDQNTELHLQAVEVKIPSIKLESFYLFYSAIAEFLADPNGYIDLTQYGSHWVHVLPSMKRARVISVSKEIPSSCPFKDYEQLRRHWKNMYGYIFPKDKEGILFYQVKFPIPKSKYLTYPGFCLAMRSIETHDCKHVELLTKQFLNDIFRSVPTICNEKLDIHRCVAQETQPSMLLMRTPEQNFEAGTRLSLPRSQLFTTDPELAAPSSLQLEFSGKYVGKLLEHTKRLETSPLSPTNFLSRIHQIHCPNPSVNNNEKLANNVNFNPNRIAATEQSSKDHLASSSTSLVHQLNSDVRKVKETKEQQTISDYFKWQKTDPQSQAKGTQLSLRQKLKNAKNKTSVTVSQYSEVEKLAKNHMLGLAKCEVLRSWLTAHCIPYNKHMRKEELIYKVVTHIKNTTNQKGI